MSTNTPLLPQHHGQRTDYGAATQEQGQQTKRTASPSSDTVHGHAEAAKGKAKRAAHKAANAAQDAKPDIEFALAALKAGKMPTTEQFVAWLHWLETSSLLQEGTYGSTGALSEEGARVVSDVRAVLEQLQSLAQEKNGDNAIQWFLYHTAHASLEPPTSEAESISSKAPSQRQAKRDGQKLLKALRQLGTLLVTDAAFNELQADLVLLARDLLADAAGTAADQVRGASDRLRPSDEQRQATGQEKRDRAIEIQGRDAEDIKQKGRDAADKVNLDKDSAKQAASQAKERGAQWLSQHTDWESPEDARNEFVDRLKRVVVSVQSKGEYQEAVDVLLNVVRQYARTAKTLTKEAGSEAKSAAKNNADENLKLALKDLRNILEAFAGGFDLDQLVQTIHKAFKDAKDERVGDYFSRLDRFIEKLLKEEGFVQTSAASRGMDKFYEEAQELLKSNPAWKEDADALQSQLQAYAHAVRTDEESRALLDALRTLADDLQSLAEQALNVLSGQSKGLFRDLTDVWLPRAISAIQVIPLPRIEYKSAELDAIVDGITLEPAGASFIPDRIEIANNNVAQLFNGYAAFSTTFDSSTKLRIEGLRIKATDVAFYLHRKKAFFHKLDYGLLSIAATGDKGVCATVELEKAKDDDKDAYFFKVKHVSVEVDTLKVSVRKSHHPISNFFFSSFAQPYLRTVICKLLEEKLGEGIGDLDEQLKLLSVRGTAVTRYAVAAHTPGQRTPGSTGTPSVTGYLGALFGQSVSPFRSLLGGSGSGGKSRFSSTSTRNAIVKKGREGDWLLTIGAPLGQHIVNAQPGPPGWAQKHEEAVRAAQSKLDQLRHVGTMGKSELRKMGRDVERKADELRQEDDWRCDEAFDIPM